jgi:hypothetical protein
MINIKEREKFRNPFHFTVYVPAALVLLEEGYQYSDVVNRQATAVLCISHKIKQYHHHEFCKVRLRLVHMNPKMVLVSS